MAIIQVKRANVILDVPDYQEAEYLAKGFDVLGPDGRVIKRTAPNDVNSLKKAYTELSEKIRVLEEENKQLKAQLASKEEAKAEKKPVKEKKPEPIEEIEEEEDEEFEPVEEEEKPAKAGRKSSKEDKKSFTPINKRGPKKSK